MTTTNVLAWRLVRYFELVLYASLAALLISKTFTFTAPLTTQDALLVLLGETLGIMASCAASPLTAALGAWMGRNSPVVEKVIEGSANILPFVRRNSSGGQASASAKDGDGRRAA